MNDSAAEPNAPVVIFLIEDELLIRELVSAGLEEAGYALLKASSGDEAVQILEGDAPPTIRAVLTDIDLGTDVSGWDVAKRARELHPDIPIIYMTGASGDDWSANGVPNSVLITKPFAPAQIVTAVSSLLNAAGSS
jgi:DNA-binding response OmpR family regulator